MSHAVCKRFVSVTSPELALHIPGLAKFPAAELLDAYWAALEISEQTVILPGTAARKSISLSRLGETRGNLGTPELSYKQKVVRFLLSKEQQGEECAVARMADSLQSMIENFFHERVNDNPKMPEERRLELLSAHEGIKTATLEVLCQLREELAPKIAKLPRLPEEMVYDGGLLRPDPGEGRERGDNHEKDCRQWARERWLSDSHFEVLESCHLVAPHDLGHGCKMELDVLVVKKSEQGDSTVYTVAAIVEAKAGVALYTDFPKLHAMYKHFFRRGSQLEVRLGRERDRRRVLCSVDTHRLPEIHYIFGAGASLQEIVLRSAHSHIKGALLSQLLKTSCSDLCDAIEADKTSAGHAIVRFGEDIIKQVEQKVEEDFMTPMNELILDGIISFWVPASQADCA